MLPLGLVVKINVCVRLVGRPSICLACLCVCVVNGICVYFNYHCGCCSFLWQFCCFYSSPAAAAAVVVDGNNDDGATLMMMMIMVGTADVLKRSVM